MGWPGNPALQRLGYTTATIDPAVATLFALEAANYGEAVVLVGRQKDLGPMLPGNVFAELEAEIVISMKPEEFAQQAFTQIGVKHSRELLCELGLELPLVVAGKRALNSLLKQRQRLTADQIVAFEKLAFGEIP